MATSWYDTIKKTKQLTVFLDPMLAKLQWKAAFDDAFKQFNALSKLHSLGVTLAISTTPPNPKGFGGADVQFATAVGPYKFTSFDQEFKGTLDGNGTHAKTAQIKYQDGRGQAIGKAFIQVPTTPQIGAPSRVAGDPVKMVMAVHELIHACGLDDNDHSPLTDPDVFYDSPSPVVGPQPKDDRMQLIQRTQKPGQPRPSQVYKLMPPVFLNGRTADLIQKNWK